MYSFRRNVYLEGATKPPAPLREGELLFLLDSKSIGADGGLAQHIGSVIRSGYVIVQGANGASLGDCGRGDDGVAAHASSGGSAAQALDREPDDDDEIDTEITPRSSKLHEGLRRPTRAEHSHTHHRNGHWKTKEVRQEPPQPPPPPSAGRCVLTEPDPKPKS